MYERAGHDGRAPRSLWLVGAEVSVFAGPLHRNAGHAHSVAVLLYGLYGTFRLRIGHGAWHSCRWAAVPAGVTYEFDMAGEPLAAVYVEPTLGSIATLASLVQDGQVCGGALVGQRGETKLLRSVFEDQASATWASEALRDLIAFIAARDAYAIDARIASAVRGLQRDGGGTCSAGKAAAVARLSLSRFQHLFSQEVGVPYRRYRGWQRMLTAIREITAGATFTVAAHSAGFADQAHFAHDFRRRFGAPASPSLSHVRG